MRISRDQSVGNGNSWQRVAWITSLLAVLILLDLVRRLPLKPRAPSKSASSLLRPVVTPIGLGYGYRDSRCSWTKLITRWQGLKIELLVQDEKTLAAALTTARKYIVHDKVHMIGGVLLTGVAYALTPLATGKKVPLIITIAAGDDLTQRKRSEYVVRLSFSASEVSHIAGDYAYNELGWRKAVTFAWDGRGVMSRQEDFREDLRQPAGRSSRKDMAPGGYGGFRSVCGKPQLRSRWPVRLHHRCGDSPIYAGIEGYGS